MRRTLGLLLSMSLAIGLSACGSQNTAAESTNSASEATSFNVAMDPDYVADNSVQSEEITGHYDADVFSGEWNVYDQSNSGLWSTEEIQRYLDNSGYNYLDYFDGGVFDMDGFCALLGFEPANAPDETVAFYKMDRHGYPFFIAMQYNNQVVFMTENDSVAAFTSYPLRAHPEEVMLGCAAFDDNPNISYKRQWKMPAEDIPALAASLIYFGKEPLDSLNMLNMPIALEYDAILYGARLGIDDTYLFLDNSYVKDKTGGDITRLRVK